MKQHLVGLKQDIIKILLYPMTRKTTQSGSPINFYKKNLEENQLGEVNMFHFGGSEIQYDSHGCSVQD